MKTALVLGGAGFLGRHLIEKLLEHGEYQVYMLDPLFNTPPQLIVGMWEGMGSQWSGRFEDWRDSWWNDTFTRRGDWPQQFDYVFHLAAGLTKYNIDERSKIGLKAFADIELDYKVAQYLETKPPRERAVWLSSSATDTYQTDPYSFVKFVGERFASTLAKHGVPISILKPFGGYGPGQSLNYPMPSIIQRALNREAPLTVWGGLNTVRDWIFVDDVVDAIMLATTHDFPVGVPVEIGTGVPKTFFELAWIISRAVGYVPEIVADTYKPTASLSRVAKTEAAEALGFKAKIPIEEGVKRCIEYQTQAAQNSANAKTVSAV